MFGYRVPAPSQAMLISGGQQRATDGDVLPFRILVLSVPLVVGGGAVWLAMSLTA